MKNSSELDIRGTVVRVVKIDGEDFICLTDMLKAKDGDFFVTDWLRNRNTLEFIGIWEQVYNPNFNYGEFATIRGQAGLNSFKIGVQEFVQRTHAICLRSKAGRYGGTYANKDIAFNAVMINDGVPQSARLRKLNEIAIQQMRILEDVGGRRLLK